MRPNIVTEVTVDPLLHLQWLLLFLLLVKHIVADAWGSLTSILAPFGCWENLGIENKMAIFLPNIFGKNLYLRPSKLPHFGLVGLTLFFGNQQLGIIHNIFWIVLWVIRIKLWILFSSIWIMCVVSALGFLKLAGIMDSVGKPNLILV